MKETNFKDTEIGKIPHDWKIVNFYKQFDKLNSASYRWNETSLSGDCLYLHYGVIHTKYRIHLDVSRAQLPQISYNQAKKYQHLTDGDLILVNASEDYEGVNDSVEIINCNKPIIAGQHTVALRSKNTALQIGFAGYIPLMPMVKMQMISFSVGTKVYSITTQMLKYITFALPSLKEQQRIATVLSDVDNLITSLDKLIEKKKLIKQGTMQDLLSGKKRLKGFNDKWQTVKLGDVADIYQPLTISSNVLTCSGFPVFGANGFIGYFSKYNHETSQVVVTCRGSSCGTINLTPNLCWITGNAMVINVDNSTNINKYFLFYKLHASNLSSLISGSGQPQIIRFSFLDFLITIPPTIEEQKEIAKILTDMDEEINALQNKKAKYINIKQAMMQELLTGRIRLI